MATILIAEDDPKILQVCKMWLTRAGHCVLEAVNGQQALELLQTRDVDVLISDVDMPVLSGTDLVTWWRVEKKSSKPVMMFTASCSPEEIHSRMQHYDVRLFPKPFSPPRLVAAIDRLLGGGAPGRPFAAPTDDGSE